MNLIDAISDSWCWETSADPEMWTPENPSYGQCAVTALVVQDYLGGKLMRAIVKWQPKVSHYWNALSGGMIDLTAQQFTEFGPIPIPRMLPEERDREYVLSFPETARRYELLSTLVAERFTLPNG